MTLSRKALSALAALVGVLSISAAPAYAGGISAHKAAQQLKADIEPLAPAFKHFEAGIKQWAKDNAGASDLSGTEPIVTQMVNAIATVGHRLRTQHWPAQSMTDVRALEKATAVLRVEIARYPSLNANDVDNWATTLQNDLDTWGNAGQALGADLSFNS